MVYLMLFSLFIGGHTMDDVYTIFKWGEFQMAPQYFHPQLDAIDPDIFIVTAQEGEYLKAVVYSYDKEDDTYWKFKGPYYLPNPQKKDFSGMPVRYVRDESCFLFADGTRLYPEWLSDTHMIGSSEKWYNLRWRRVYKNYYMITIFRGERHAIREYLMTAKDGTDLTPILGESSKEKDFKGYNAVLTTDEPFLGKREKKRGGGTPYLDPPHRRRRKGSAAGFPQGPCSLDPLDVVFR